MPTDDGGPVGLVDRVNAWVLTELPSLNTEILARRRPPGDLAAELERSVLGDLPRPESLPVRQAQQLVVLLGLAGASVSRHYQELDPGHVASPERAFNRCAVGGEAVPFLTYFQRLADRTGTGHCYRDSYASLTRWNVPTTEVWWGGERIATLPGVFGDGLVRTYTGTPDEQRFFELIKTSEAIELAINETLMPISDTSLDVLDPEALDRVGLAVTLLAELRLLNAHFTALPPEDGLRADYFMDVFRQYAVHWTPDDIPPSGALDPEAIARDCLLGVHAPGYEEHTRRIFPALLDSEREMLTRLMERPSLPAIALNALSLDPQTLAGMSLSQLRTTVRRHPVLAALYLLLIAQARMSGLHLKMTKKYLFTPQRQRETAGLDDRRVVSNRLGTTGMDERYLEDLTRARRHHGLVCLHALGDDELYSLARLDAAPAASSGLTALVRFAGPDSPQTHPPAWLVRTSESSPAPSLPPAVDPPAVDPPAVDPPAIDPPAIDLSEPPAGTPGPISVERASVAAGALAGGIRAALRGRGKAARGQEASAESQPPPPGEFTRRDAQIGADQLVALIDNTNAVIYMRDLDGRYLLVNREYERLFHRRREDIVGHTDHDLFPAKIADEFRANDLAAAASGGPVQMEEVAPGEDGLHTYVTVKFPLLDDQGQAYAVCGISTDITDRKLAEEQVRQLNAELEQRVHDRTAALEASTRELDAFAYSVSHDLRAPLRSLHGFSELLLEDYADRLDADGQQYLQRIQASVARMGQLIDDLLRLSRVTRTELKREQVDIGAQANEIIEALRSAEPDRSVDVVMADSLVAAGDSHLIRLVLDNLLSNAWKFTSKCEHAVIGVGTVREQGEQVFFVSDNGAGFNMRYVDKIFDPFQRLHATTEFEGSGIGLAIVHRIVIRHGGRIWVDSQLDKGTIFYFSFESDKNDLEKRP